MSSRFRGRRAEGGDDALIEQFFAAPKRRAAARGAERKSKQLCREVYRVLTENLTTATVVEVRPAPDTARLAVLVQPAPGDDPWAVREALERDRGRLRAEIARALQRKRTPDLVFEVVP
jgi:ribosome-binding factor A